MVVIAHFCALAAASALVAAIKRSESYGTSPPSLMWQRAATYSVALFIVFILLSDKPSTETELLEHLHHERRRDCTSGMIGDHIKIMMDYLNALGVPHYKKKSHHH
jgi:hypothetical protein